jgi:hypothetical protein
MDQELIRQAIEAHQSSSGTYGAPVDHAIDELCKEFERGDYVRMALLCAVDLGLDWQAIRKTLTEHGLWRAMTCSTTAAINHAAVSGPVAQLRLMLAALDQAGLSVAGQEAVRALLGAPA